VKHFTWLASLIAANGASLIDPFRHHHARMSGLEFLPKAKAARPDVRQDPLSSSWSIPDERTSFAAMKRNVTEL